jgi:hypothetical protein
MNGRKDLASIYARLVVATLSVVAFRALAEPPQCSFALSEKRFTDFFSQMHSNLAFRNGKVVGFRVYDHAKSDALLSLGLRSEDLVTHFCGVGIDKILSASGDICCAEAVGETVQLTVERDKNIIRVVAPMPNRAFQRTLEDSRR